MNHLNRPLKRQADYQASTPFPPHARSVFSTHTYDLPYCLHISLFVQRPLLLQFRIYWFFSYPHGHVTGNQTSIPNCSDENILWFVNKSIVLILADLTTVLMAAELKFIVVKLNDFFWLRRLLISSPKNYPSAHQVCSFHSPIIYHIVCTLVCLCRDLFCFNLDTFFFHNPHGHAARNQSSIPNC